MAATGPSGVRALWPLARIALCIFATTAYADPQAEVLDLINSMTAALSDDNVPGFMAAFDRSMHGYDKLKVQIAAMLEQGDVESDVEPIKNEGDPAQRSLDLDWYLVIRSSAPNGPSIQRRQIVHCELRKEKKHWRIVTLSPLEFFAPASFGDRAGQ